MSKLKDQTDTWNPMGVVRSVALQFGLSPSDDECGHILWNFTGYPSFFMHDAEEECAQQVRSYYECVSIGCSPCPRCGRPAPAADICEPCVREIQIEDAA